MKKVVEKVEMVIDAQKSFAQVYEDRYMNKRIRGKMMKLDPIIIQEDRNEIRAGKTQVLNAIGLLILMAKSPA